MKARRSSLWKHIKRKHYDKYKEILFNETSINPVEVCVNCDKEKETYSICSDCLTKIINENTTASEQKA